MNDSNDQDRLFVCRCALVLFIAGLVVPLSVTLPVLILAPHRITAILFAYGFGLIAEVLALVFGCLGDRDRLFVARCSLLLFIAGLLVPFIIAVMLLSLGEAQVSPVTAKAATVLAITFGIVAEVLALVFGICGRRHLPGRIGMSPIACLVWLLRPFASLISQLWRERELTTQRTEDGTRPTGSVCYHCGQPIEQGLSPCPACGKEVDWSEG